MAVIDFADLQALSGYKQASKVMDWLRENQIRFVIGGDGSPARLATYWRVISMPRKKGSLPPYVLSDKYGYRLKPYLAVSTARQSGAKQ